MSNIGLLMASVLTTGIPSAKELPYSPQVEASFEEASEQQNQQLKHKEVKQEQEKLEIQSSQIAPPETLEPDMSGSNITLKIERGGKFSKFSSNHYSRTKFTTQHTSSEWGSRVETKN